VKGGGGGIVGVGVGMDGRGLWGVGWLGWGDRVQGGASW
jgi:hypothetical protein